MTCRDEIAAMLRRMPSGWQRQYAVGRATLAQNGGPVLPNAPTPEQAMLILGNTAGGKADADTARGDQPVPKAVRDAAMHGLRLSYKNNYGGWEFFGIARAIQLALMPSVPMRTRQRMVRYLSDHEKDKSGANFGNDAHPSKGYMAWLNWGGDPAVAWNARDGIKRAAYGAAASRTNGAASAARTDPELWEEVKAEVTRGARGGLPGQWSARKAQMAVALYKAEGGGYVGPKSPDNALARWTRERWRTKSGRPSLLTGERYLPAAAIDALTPAEYAATTRAKRAGMRKGEQFVPQPESIAEKVKRYRRNPWEIE